jgi:protein-S-isoprenylcysteine O-methyltransferase Ste14
LLWCVLGFLVEGRGTLAPIDPPRRLVTGRLYQHVRNPMYVGLLTLLAGEAVGFGSIDLTAYAVAVAACVHLFVIGYEEPSLHRRFGAAYDQYRQAVPRWIPRPRSASPSR